MTHLIKPIGAAAILCLFPTTHVLAESPATAPESAVVDPAFTGPKAPCAAYFEAMRRCDLEAVVACFVHEEKDTEALKVGMGLFIAHRRFEKAVEARFGLDEETRAECEGWFRPDMTDAAIDASMKRLARAVVTVDEDSATAELRWHEADSAMEDYCDLLVKKLCKVDGVWKLDAGKQNGDFFQKGGWGRMFRNMMKTMNQAADKVAAGEFRSVDELKAHMDARQKELEQEYEDELRETDWRGNQSER